MIQKRGEDCLNCAFCKLKTGHAMPRTRLGLRWKYREFNCNKRRDDIREGMDTRSWVHGEVL